MDVQDEGAGDEAGGAQGQHECEVQGEDRQVHGVLREVLRHQDQVDGVCQQHRDAGPHLLTGGRRQDKHEARQRRQEDDGRDDADGVENVPTVG